MCAANSTGLAPAAYKLFRKTTQVTSPTPSDLFIFQDVYPDSICWPYFGVNMGGLGLSHSLIFLQSAMAKAELSDLQTDIRVASLAR